MNTPVYTISTKTVDLVAQKKYFAKFVELGLLEVEGKNKGRKYKINKKQ